MVQKFRNMKQTSQNSGLVPSKNNVKLEKQWKMMPSSKNISGDTVDNEMEHEDEAT